MESFGGYFLYLMISLASLGLWSCHPPGGPGVVLIAMDDFSVNDVVCNQDQIEDEKSGWSKVCRESIRFTHAYTTSTMTVPALTSLLTGEYPFKHGLRFNSKQKLKLEFTAIAEEAVQQGWRTSFYSGGAPVFRKTGLHQGFEYFDDYWNVSPTEIYKSLNNNIADFKNWFAEEVNSSPFFAVFYVPDLAYGKAETKEDYSLSRTSAMELQLDELGTNLQGLFKYLEKSRRWKDSTVILVGLHGRSDEFKSQETKGNDLSSPNIQVGLFIKPPQVGNIYLTPWTVDKPVNLADVGRTIQELISNRVRPPGDEFWPLNSLKSDMSHSINAKQQPERYLLIESLWEPWVQGTPWNRAAVVNKNQLFSFSPMEGNNLKSRVEVFNLLIETSENSLLKKHEYEEQLPDFLEKELKKINFKQKIVDGLQSPINQEVEPIHLTKKYRRSPGVDLDWRARILEIPHSYWIDPSAKSELLKSIYALYHDFPSQPQVRALAVRMAMEVGDWPKVLSIGIERDDKAIIQLAILNLTQKGEVSKEYREHLNLARGDVLPHKCFDLVNKSNLTSRDIRGCSDPLFNKFLLEKSKNDPFREFERFFEISVLRDTLRRYDLALQIRVDPQHLDVSWPGLFEIFLALPDNQKLRNQLFRNAQRRILED